MSSVAPAPSKLGIAAPTRKRLGSRFTGRASPTRTALSFAGEGCPPGESHVSFSSAHCRLNRIELLVRRAEVLTRPSSNCARWRLTERRGRTPPGLVIPAPLAAPGSRASRPRHAVPSATRDSRAVPCASGRHAGGVPTGVRVVLAALGGGPLQPALTVSRGTSSSRIHGDPRALRSAGGPEPRLEYRGSSFSLPGHSCPRSLRMASSRACRVASAWRIMLS